MQKKTNKRAQYLFATFLCLLLVATCVRGVIADAPMDAAPFLLDGNFNVDITINENDGADSHEYWYQISIPADGYTEFNIMSYCGDSVSFKLMNSDLSKNYFDGCGYYVSGGSETSPKTATAGKALSPGTYYLGIVAPKSGRFRIKGTFKDYKTNDAGADSYDAPFDYKLGTSITGAITVTDEVDWYKVKITSKSKYPLSVKTYTDSTYVEIYNDDLSNRVASLSVGGGSLEAPKAEYTVPELSKGTYYIKVTSGLGKYVMKFSKAGKCKLNATIKRKKKSVTIKTNKSAYITARYAGESRSAYASSDNGKATIYFYKKLKKGKKIKITVTHNDYTTTTKTYKIK
ncbi:MAG: hypothetical protein IKQ71_02855 [Lachnospiraceae bacterium]|nr:hypothetical protein [Lachnospiraceae bacterium]